MEYNEPELKEAIKKFEYLVKKTSDNDEASFVYKNFLRTIIRIKPKSFNMPTAAFMSIIKQEKPVAYRLLKREAEKSDYLYFLTNIEMDYNDAKTHIEQIKSQLK